MDQLPPCPLPPMMVMMSEVMPVAATCPRLLSATTVTGLPLKRGNGVITPFGRRHPFSAGHG